MQLRLALPAATKQMLDRYVAFVGQTSRRAVEAREIAVELLEHFMTSDRGFRQWQKLAQKSVFESHESRIEKSPQTGGTEPSEELWSAVLRIEVWREGWSVVWVAGLGAGRRAR